MLGKQEYGRYDVLMADSLICEFLDWWTTEGTHTGMARLEILLNHFRWDKELLSSLEVWLREHIDADLSHLHFSSYGHTFTSYNGAKFAEPIIITRGAPPSPFGPYEQERLRKFCDENPGLVELICEVNGRRAKACV